MSEWYCIASDVAVIAAIYFGYLAVSKMVDKKLKEHAELVNKEIRRIKFR